MLRCVIASVLVVRRASDGCCVMCSRTGVRCALRPEPRVPISGAGRGLLGWGLNTELRASALLSPSFTPLTLVHTTLTLLPTHHYARPPPRLPRPPSLLLPPRSLDERPGCSC